MILCIRDKDINVLVKSYDGFRAIRERTREVPMRQIDLFPGLVGVTWDDDSFCIFEMPTEKALEWAGSQSAAITHHERTHHARSQTH